MPPEINLHSDHQRKYYVTVYFWFGWFWDKTNWKYVSLGSDAIGQVPVT